MFALNPSSGILRSLKHRNFRLFFIGQGISLIGTWMDQVAMSWLVYRLTHSAFLLGLVSFSTLIPSFFFTPVAGVLADRWDRHRILLLTQTLLMVEAFLTAFLTLTHLIQIWQILALGLFFGFVNALDIPARQAFMVTMVEDRQNLPNAIALNSTLFNAARLVGPAIAGLTISWVGEGMCFLINGLSFLAVLAALLIMRIPAHASTLQKRQSGYVHLKEGIRYIKGFPPITAILILLASVSFFGVPYSVLMPIFATKVLGGGPHTLGFLMGSSGCGALLGAVYLAGRKTVRGLLRIMIWTGISFGLSIAAFSMSHALWVSMGFLLVIGFSMMVQVGGGNIVLQTIVDEDKRGRVMSFYAMALMGIAPIGSLLAGWVATQAGAPRTVLGGGLFCVLSVLVFATQYKHIRELIRPVYARMGIIPEASIGLQPTPGLMSPPK